MVDVETEHRCGEVGSISLISIIVCINSNRHNFRRPAR